MKKKQLANKTVKIIIILALIVGLNVFNKNSQAINTVLTLELNTNENPVREQYGLNLQQTLREIGIDLIVNVLDWGTFVGSALAKPPNYQLGIIGFSNGFSAEISHLIHLPGIDPDLSRFYHSTGGLNLFGPWNNSYNDDLLEAGLATADPAERKIIYDQWQEYVMDELPCLPLTNPTIYTARKATIRNYYPAYGLFYPSITRADAGTTIANAASSDSINLNPVLATDDYSLTAIAPCLDGLYTYDYNLSVVPQLASTNPIISENGLNWTISLREDIFWQDGEQFTADDVYFSVMAYCNPDNFLAYGLSGDTSSLRSDYWAGIYDGNDHTFTGNVTVLDPFTVQFLLPDTYVLFQTNGLFSNIIPEHLLNVSDSNFDGFISDETAWQNYNNGSYHIGTGAYYFTANDWIAETQYIHNLRTNVTNPYWISNPESDANNVPFDLKWTLDDVYQIEQVITRIIPQVSNQIQLFEAGGIDFVNLFANPELIPIYEFDPRFNVTSAPSYAYDLLHFNLEDPVFKADPAKGKALRKAIAYATARENMVATIKDGRAVVCDNPMSPANTFFYNWDNPIIYRYNIETASDYMIDAGYFENYPPYDIDPPWPDPIPPINDPTSDPSDDQKGILSTVLRVTGVILLITLKIVIGVICALAGVGVLVFSYLESRRYIKLLKSKTQRKKIAALIDFLEYCSMKVSVIEYIDSKLETHSDKVNRSRKIDDELERIKRDIEDYEVVEFINSLMAQKYNSLIMKELSKLDEAFFSLTGEISYLEKERSMKTK